VEVEVVVRALTSVNQHPSSQPVISREGRTTFTLQVRDSASGSSWAGRRAEEVRATECRAWNRNRGRRGKEGSGAKRDRAWVGRELTSGAREAG
jgi:hypothetical protein